VHPRAGGDGLGGVLSRLEAAPADASAPRLILADCTASDTTALHLRALAAGAAVALANKAPMACPLPQFAQLTAQPRRLRAESTVGAGLPVHATLARVVAAGDAVSRIAGAFSGTLGFVMSGTFAVLVRCSRARFYC
jgi:homoserine dehydrogenase